VEDQGPRFISVGWVSRPRDEPKKGQEMIGPMWNGCLDWSGRGSTGGAAVDLGFVVLGLVYVVLR